jgi:phenylalanyl-tRNA synthetase beta subunit
MTSVPVVPGANTTGVPVLVDTGYGAPPPAPTEPLPTVAANSSTVVMDTTTPLLNATTTGTSFAGIDAGTNTATDVSTSTAFVSAASSTTRTASQASGSATPTSGANTKKVMTLTTVLLLNLVTALFAAMTWNTARV